MVKDYIALNHNYSRSNYDFFPIIRTKDEYPEPGEDITLGFEYIEHKAVVILKVNMKVKEVPTPLLCLETGAENREDSVRILKNVFDEDLNPESKITILFINRKE